MRYASFIDDELVTLKYTLSGLSYKQKN